MFLTIFCCIFIGRRGLLNIDAYAMFLTILCCVFIGLGGGDRRRGATWAGEATHHGKESRRGQRSVIMNIYQFLSSSRNNPSNAEATFIQKTKMQTFLKIIPTLSCCYSLDSFRRILSDEYPYARISVINQLFCIILHRPR